MRITKMMLENRITRLNKTVGFNEKINYNTVGGYRLDAANGGYILEKIMCPAGSVNNVFSIPRVSIRALYDLVNAYISGKEAKEENDKHFKITSIHKDDLKSTFKHNQTALDIIDGLDDADMKELASKMEDDYVTQLFWSSLEIIFADLHLRGKE